MSNDTWVHLYNSLEACKSERDDLRTRLAQTEAGRTEVFEAYREWMKDDTGGERLADAITDMCGFPEWSAEHWSDECDHQSSECHHA